MLINHDPVMDFDLFYGKVNIGRPCIRMGKIVKLSFKEQNLQEMGKWTENQDSKKIWTPGAIYMYITIIFNNLLL